MRSLSRSHLIAMAFVATAIGVPAIAQTVTSAGQFISAASPGDWRASKLVGVGIYGPNEESIGKVDDVIVDSSGATKAVVIGVGGFLGMGKKDVAMPFSEIKWSDKPAEKVVTADTTMPAGGAMRPAAPLPAVSAAVYDYPDHGTVTLTKDQLKAAPDFKYASAAK